MTRPMQQSPLCGSALCEAVQWGLHREKAGLVPSEIHGSLSGSFVIPSTKLV